MTETRSVWLAGARLATPGRLERWLEEEAAAGWQPRHVASTSAIRLVLHRMVPAQVSYATSSGGGVGRSDEVHDAWSAAGWEYVGDLTGDTGTQLWRKPSVGGPAHPPSTDFTPSGWNRSMVQMALYVCALAALSTLAMIVVAVTQGPDWSGIAWTGGVALAMVAVVAFVVMRFGRLSR